MEGLALGRNDRIIGQSGVCSNLNIPQTFALENCACTISSSKSFRGLVGGCASCSPMRPSGMLSLCLAFSYFIESFALIKFCLWQNFLYLERIKHITKFCLWQNFPHLERIRHIDERKLIEKLCGAQFSEMGESSLENFAEQNFQ